MKKKIILFISMVVIACVMCFGYISGHYSTDDYYIMNIGYHNYSINNNLAEGRTVMFLIDQFYNFFNISYDAFIISTVCLAILFTVINIFLVYSLLQHYFKNKKLLWVILFSTIFNFMYLENLYFVESIVMSLSLVFYTLSAKYFFKEDKNNLIKSFIFNVLAVFCYNSFECYFIVLVSFISLMQNKKFNKTVVFDILKAGLMVAFSVLLVFAQIGITNKLLALEHTRMTGSILNNIFVIAYFGIPKVLIESCFLLPKYLFIVCILFLLILSTINKKRKKLFIENLYLLLICILSCFCISIFTLSSFGTGRMMYGVGMAIGIILLNLLKNIEKEKKYYYILIFFSIIWTSFNVINYSYMTYLSKKQNTIDQKETLKLDKLINEYEKDNNIVVDTYICIFDNTDLKSSIIVRDALKSEWSSAGVINYYTGRSLKRKKITESENNNYIKIMKDKDYYFDSNKLFIKIYDW